MDRHSFSPEGFTLRNIRRDFPEWHRGRPDYYLWALNVDAPAITQRVQAAQQHLAGLLLADYLRQAHVTLSLCGFPGREQTYPDDFTALDLGRQLSALDQARLPPFEIEIGALDSFTSAPYLSVRAPDDNLATLRRCLASKLTPETANRDFVPHVTVGLYAGAWPMSAVAARLKSFAGREMLPLRITRLCLMSYQSSQIGGRLRTMATYDLAQGFLPGEEMPHYLLDTRSLP